MLLAWIVAITVAWLAAAPIPALAQPAPHPTRWYPAPTAEEQQREERLDRRLPEVDFQAAPLQNVVDILRQRSGLFIAVDWTSIGPVGITPETPVTYRARDLELRHILTAICESIRNDRDLVVDFDSLRITTDESRYRRANMTTRSYPVRDILEFGAAWGRILEKRYPEEITGSEITAEIRENGTAGTAMWLNSAADEFCTSVTLAVSPDAWEINGGIGSIGFYGPTLVIRSNYDVHAETADLLRSVRLAIAAFDTPRFSGGEPRSVHAGSAPRDPAGRANLHAPFYARAAADQRIADALASPAPAALPTDATLAAAIAALQASAPITIDVDWRTFEDCGVKRDEWITLGARPATTGQYLDAVLRCAAKDVLHLGAQNRPTGLRITTCESFRPSTRVYNISDLVDAHVRWRRAAIARDRASSGGPGAEPNPDAGDDDIHVCERCTTGMIADVLTQFVTPDAWEINGGISSLTFVGPLLIVRTHYAWHRDHIQEYLDGLAKSLEADGVGPPSIRKSETRAKGGG